MQQSLPLPRHHQVYLVLRERIAAGEFPPEQPLPGELELAKGFGVSRVTMRAALGRLAREHLITRHRGRGTFPRPTAAAPATAELSGLLENILCHGLKTTVRVIQLSDLPAPADVAAALQLAPGASVRKAVRVRSYRGAPVSHITTFVPLDVARFSKRALSGKPMLQLLEDAGVRIASAEQTISARLSDPGVARLLEVGVGTPLLAVARTVYAEGGRPVQLLRGLYRPDRYEYRMQLTRSGGDTPRVWVSDDSKHHPRQEGTR